MVIIKIPERILEPFGETGIPTFGDCLTFNELVDYIGDELEDFFRQLYPSSSDPQLIEEILEKKALELGAVQVECNANTSNIGDSFVVHAYVMYYYIEDIGWPFMKILTNKFPRVVGYGDHIK